MIKLIIISGEIQLSNNQNVQLGCRERERERERERSPLEYPVFLYLDPGPSSLHRTTHQKYFTPLYQ